MCISHFFFLSVVVVVAITIVEAHSNLGYPMPYNRLACKADAKWCHGACPPIWKTGWARARNSPGRPAAIWRRGQLVNIVYHKNNHRGGFFRRSLVPVQHMFDRAWHCRGAFQWGCWSQGSFKCGRSQLCGEDQFGLSYRTKMKVPEVFPDGDYVFSQVWYGGVFWRGNRPEFPDYTSCSFVRIRGGPRTMIHYPTFTRGYNRRRSIPKGVCETGSVWLNECGGQACIKKKVRYTRPGEFLRGRKPPPVKAAFYKGPNRPRFHRAPKPRLYIRRQHWRPKTNRSWHPKVRHRSGGSMLRNRKGNGPVHKVWIQVGNRVVSKLRNGERAWLRAGNKAVHIEAYTGRARPRAIFFKIHGRHTWTERKFPYVYHGNKGRRRLPWRRPIYNRWFVVTVLAKARNGRMYTTKVRLFLAK